MSILFLLLPVFLCQFLSVSPFLPPSFFYFSSLLSFSASLPSPCLSLLPFLLLTLLFSTLPLHPLFLSFHYPLSCLSPALILYLSTSLFSSLSLHFKTPFLSLSLFSLPSLLPLHLFSSFCSIIFFLSHSLSLSILSSFFLL